MQVTAISGLGDKAPACFLVEAGGARLLLDLGKGTGAVPLPDVSGVGKVDAILISHGHEDHIGALDLAERVGAPPIHATATTRAFAGHKALAEARELPIRGETVIAGLPVTTGRAGHAAGGVWIRIGGDDGVLYSGDLSRESVLYPYDPPPRAETLIADASYGAYDLPIDAGRQMLLEHARRGPLLLPLPPTGRGVEIAVVLHEAGLPVAICEKHRAAAEVMVATEDDALVPQARERIAAMLAGAMHIDPDGAPQGTMIAANGAATGGMAQTLFERFCDDPSVTILFTGHVERDTAPGRAIREGRTLFSRWNVHPRLSDLRWLVKTVQPRRTLLAFCGAEQREAAATALGIAAS
jgi:Cft2 family RNA processing exonuclease